MSRNIARRVVHGLICVNYRKTQPAYAHPILVHSAELPNEVVKASERL